MLTTKDVVLMIGAGVGIVIATECMIYAITGTGLLLR